MYKKVLDNLELNVNLGFMKINNIQSKVSVPQGMKMAQ